MAKWEKSVMRKRVIFLACLAAVLVGITIIYNQFQSPSVGTITEHTSAQENVKSAEQTRLNLEGDTFQLTYPGFYSKTRSGAPENQIVEQYSLSGVDGVRESRRISITIKKPLAGEGLTDDSAYQFRRGEPATYIQSTRRAGTLSLEKFQKADKSEITYFYLGKTYYAIIAGTSTNNTGGLAADMNTVIQSFEWKN